MLVHKSGFQCSEDYRLLIRSLGSLTPTVQEIEWFCRNAPGWSWDNYPIDSRIFPIYPGIKVSFAKEVKDKIREILFCSDSEGQEYSFILGGHERVERWKNFWKPDRQLQFTELYFNAGGRTYTGLNLKNQGIRDAYNSKEGQLMILGHTHPNFGPTRRCFSISDLLFGITNSAWLRQQFPQPVYKVIFSLAYREDDGTCQHVLLIYDPERQQKGDTAIFRLSC